MVSNIAIQVSMYNQHEAGNSRGSEYSFINHEQFRSTMGSWLPYLSGQSTRYDICKLWVRFSQVPDCPLDLHFTFEDDRRRKYTTSKQPHKTCEGTIGKDTNISTIRLRFSEHHFLLKRIIQRICERIFTSTIPHLSN